jgi:hypothetical protein
MEREKAVLIDFDFATHVTPSYLLWFPPGQVKLNRSYRPFSARPFLVFSHSDPDAAGKVALADVSPFIDRLIVER